MNRPIHHTLPYWLAVLILFACNFYTYGIVYLYLTTGVLHIPGGP